MRISGHIIDIRKRRIYDGEIEVADGIIHSIKEIGKVDDQVILPGFIDAHVHIESSMVVPSEFARMAVVHGTVATVSDPHEIGNVIGIDGVEYMIENGKQVPFKFYFGAPSCVPATPFETSGGVIDTAHVASLLEKKEVRYLAEMMNWPGVLDGDPDVMARIECAKRNNKVVDGHAPGLRGEQARKYAAAGISTDHECFTAPEALDKLSFGMKILIREGSAAKNFDALAGLINDHWENMMLCSDDKHPDSLEAGHINLLVKRALAMKIDLFKILTTACINPVDHYKLDVGTLSPGDPADFIVIDNLVDFRITKTFINGILVAENGKTKIAHAPSPLINNFFGSERRREEFAVRATGHTIRVMEALDGQLITNTLIEAAAIRDGFVVSDTTRDILKIVVVNRYAESNPSVAFIKNFGLKTGAIASSVGHDSHNIIAVGVDDASIERVVNLIIRFRGGVAAFDGKQEKILPLPVAGIMSNNDGYVVSKAYQEIDRMAKQMGSKLGAPFMTLSFMALLVIPALKISDKGLFDSQKFEFVDLFVD
ncbi:MAG TPA: adenine deaminase [Cyclobacteriaceae bacterium]|nr:adenine deaminase [Cyclobacteriaceae bacterium]